jgi:hypothetical protein
VNDGSALVFIFIIFSSRWRLSGAVSSRGDCGALVRHGHGVCDEKDERRTSPSPWIDVHLGLCETRLDRARASDRYMHKMGPHGSRSSCCPLRSAVCLAAARRYAKVLLYASSLSLLSSAEYAPRWNDMRARGGM